MDDFIVSFWLCILPHCLEYTASLQPGLLNFVEKNILLSKAAILNIEHFFLEKFMDGP